MKNLWLILTCFVLSLIYQHSLCQVPQGFKYQAVCRDNTGAVIQNQSVNLRLSVHDLDPSGNIVYQETFIVVTNQFGLIMLDVGSGNVQSGNFAAIPWETGDKFLEVELDLGTGYTSMGTTQLLSVPYAIHSKTAESITGGITETDPEVGTNSLNYLSKWDGAALGVSSIFDNGNVGIGMENPGKKLTVAGNAQVQSDGDWYPGATARLYLGPDDNMWIEHIHSGGLNLEVCSGWPLYFRNGGSVTMAIDGSGNVGIGTMYPSAKLDVWDGNITVSNGGIISNYGFWGDALRTNNGNDLTLQSSYEDRGIIFTTYSGEKMRMDAAGNVGIGTQSPGSLLDVNGVINASGGNSDNWNTAYSWGNHETAGYLTIEADGVIGNEIVNAANATLTRNGSGTAASPFTLSLNLANVNTWSGAQTFSTNTYFPGTSVWTSTGKVGIGTTNPGAGSKLEVWDGNVTVLNGGVLANTGFWGDILRTNWGNDLTLQSSYADKGILFRTQSGEKMRINAAGNVGIGTTNPSYMLDVQGDIRSTGTLYGSSGIISATTTPAVLDVNGIGNSSHIRLFSGQDNSQIFLSDYAGTMGIQLWHTGKAFFAGNVGIGTNSPSSILHLIGDSPRLKIQTQTNLTDPSLEFVKYGVRTMEIKLTDGGAGTGLQFIDQNSEQVRMYIKASTGNVGIGTIFPGATLDVNGQVRISGGSPAVGKVLTSDATGLATWESPATTGAHYIGEAYGGGIVFYVYDNGQHGLIASTTDQSSGIQWSNGIYKYTGTTGDGLGAGAMNTTLIVATQVGDLETGNFAAKVCSDYAVTDNGMVYGDWYLPSKYESDLLYLQKDIVGGFSDADYWTSTEEPWANSFAKHKYFGNGAQTFPSDVKYHPYKVRAIRSF